MKIGSWNIRGVSRPFKQKELRLWINRNHLCLVGVLETRVRERNATQIINSIAPSWHSITNYNQHVNGRIWLLWDPAVIAVRPLQLSAQMIHLEVLLL